MTQALEKVEEEESHVEAEQDVHWKINTGATEADLDGGLVNGVRLSDGDGTVRPLFYPILDLFLQAVCISTFLGSVLPDGGQIGDGRGVTWAHIIQMLYQEILVRRTFG